MASDYGPEFDRFAGRVRRELVPKIEGSRVFLAITPSSPDKVDVKFALELGIAVMLGKPIIAVIPPGTAIPEKLARVVDRFVELDLRDPSGKQRLTEVLQEMLVALKSPPDPIN
jgi:hypothetical protein